MVTMRTMDSELAAALRREYTDRSFGEESAGDDPVALFDAWLSAAVDDGLPEPHAMTVATADERGRPSARVVLLKSFDAAGAVFASSHASRKGEELAANPWASAVLWWPPQFRQVRIEGPVSRVSEAESDAIFAARPRGAQIAAAASYQSHPIADRAALDDHVHRVEKAVGEAPVARPHDWGGFRIALERLEFWQGRSSRLHDRIIFESTGDGWRRSRLQP